MSLPMFPALFRIVVAERLDVSRSLALKVLDDRRSGIC